MRSKHTLNKLALRIDVLERRIHVLEDHYIRDSLGLPPKPNDSTHEAECPAHSGYDPRRYNL